MRAPCVCALLAHSHVQPRQLDPPSRAQSGLTQCNDSVWLVDGGDAQPLRVSRLVAPASLLPASSDGTDNRARCLRCADSRAHWLPGRATALELCCGTGASVVHLAQHGFHSVGVDIAPAALSACRINAQQAQLLHPDTRVTDAVASPRKGSAVFACADVLSLPRPFTHSAALQLATDSDSPRPALSDEARSAQHAASTGANEQQQQQGHGSAAPFDFIYDCQSYHVLRQVRVRRAYQAPIQSLSCSASHCSSRGL